VKRKASEGGNKRLTEATSHRAALWLLAMKGHPATGKSTLARALAQHFSWPLIDKDDIKDHLLAAPGGNELAYAGLWQVVERQLALGVSVIADSPLSYPAGYAAAQALARRIQKK
jgi:predicted kinase